MKQLLTVLLVFFTGVSFVFGQKWPITLEEVLKKDEQQPHNRGVQYREEFPVLFIDSVYSEKRGYGTNEISVISYEHFRYNTENKIIQYDYKVTRPPDFLADWYRTTYQLNDQGNEVSSMTVSDNYGIVTNSAKSNSMYNDSNKIIEKISYSWTGSWTPTHTIRYEYPNSFTTIEAEQILLNGIWVNSWRNTQVLNDSGYQTNNINEVWDTSLNNWKKKLETVFEYDTNENLILSQSGFGNPFKFEFKVEYHYDAQGRNDSIKEYYWSNDVNIWVQSSLTNLVFNAEDQIIEKVNYTIDILGAQALSHRELLIYNEGIFSQVFREILYQVWDDSSQVFLDNAKRILEYNELSDNYFFTICEYKNKLPPDFHDWFTPTHIEAFFHTGSGIPPPRFPQPCQAPNPYPTNHKVTCDGLQENGSYMLYVYDAQGRMAYARHFKGGDGWSIHQNLPTGVYIAAIVRNGERISAQRLVIGR